MSTSMRDGFWSATRTLRRRYNRLWLADHSARTVLRRETWFTARRLRVHDELVRLALRLAGEASAPAPANGVSSPASASGASIDLRRPIDRVTDIDPHDFQQRYFDTDTPVVMAGAGAAWPAAKWTHEMIGERYNVEVPHRRDLSAYRRMVEEVTNLIDTGLDNMLALAQENARHRQ